MAFVSPPYPGSLHPGDPEPLGAGKPAMRGMCRRHKAGARPPPWASSLLPAPTPPAFRPIRPRCSWNFDGGSNKSRSCRLAAEPSGVSALAEAGEAGGGGGMVVEGAAGRGLPVPLRGDPQAPRSPQSAAAESPTLRQLNPSSEDRG